MSLYLYCLKEAGAVIPPIKAPGVNGQGGVFIRAFDGIAAVVSAGQPGDFEAMQKKAQDDICWIKEKALAHEMVVEEAMGKSVPVIPVKFGVIFNTEARLAETLQGQKTEIRSAFDRIRGKQEWSVKLFLADPEKFKAQVREQDENFQAQSRQLAGLPAGQAYFMETELNAELERECARRLNAAAGQVFAELETLAAAAVKVKLLDGKLTGRRERMLLNAACLVAFSRLPEFRKMAAQLRARLAPGGFLLEERGPWPAYHFTEFGWEGTEAQRQKAQRDGDR